MSGWMLRKDRFVICFSLSVASHTHTIIIVQLVNFYSGNRETSRNTIIVTIFVDKSRSRMECKELMTANHALWHSVATCQWNARNHKPQMLFLSFFIETAKTYAVRRIEGVMKRKLSRVKLFTFLNAARSKLVTQSLNVLSITCKNLAHHLLK